MLYRATTFASLLTIMFLAAPVRAQEQEGITILPGTATRATSVRRRPSARQSIIRRLPANASVRVLSPETRRGFWRVILPGGRQGYVSARDLAIPEAAMHAAAPTAAAAAPACASDIGACNAQGCAADDSDKALFNKAKNHLPSGTRSISISFPDLRSLQRQADRLVEQGTGLSQEQRDSLGGLSVANGRAGEGKFVRLVGFIANGLDPHANTGESVNCNLRNQVSNDFHIPIALRASDTEFQGIVVEMIPHERPETWTLDRLKKVKRQALRVMVVGGLFYDNDHVVNADPTDNLGGQPKRFALWEVHPITQFFVCRRAGNACSAADVRQWTKLEDFQ
ncbi:MAG: SH3 domain-containing protein [Acidobacteriota bacterium]